MKRTLIDAGPLIALFDRDDIDHERCVAVSRHLHGEVVTVWPVITEASHLLADVPRAQDALLAKVETGDLVLADLTAADVPILRALIQRYQDQPMDLADAAMVRVAAREGITEVFTLDRHFRTYRGARGRAFTLKP
ncbi:MAG TPA: hypothetical protein VIV15_00025 [Anaerolineales bacterium]